MLTLAWRCLLLFFLGLGISGNPTARAEKTDGRPVVVLIGDSIRIGYAPFVQDRLKGTVELINPSENGGDSANVLKHLDEWAIQHHPAVVHFNTGIHDAKPDPKSGGKQVPLLNYKHNLAEIVRRLETQTSARIIFATTTPWLDAKLRPIQTLSRRSSDVALYNNVAIQVMSSRADVAIDDLHAAISKFPPRRVMNPDGIHFNADGYRVLGDQVALAITKALDRPAATTDAVCRWAAKSPTIDGKLDDPVWETATVIDTFPSYWDNTPSGTGTRARLLWNHDGLYYSATMTDKELRSFGTKRNDTLWNGDVFELFFKPSDEKPAYNEFQVNPKSVILELPFRQRGEDFQKLAAAPPSGYTAMAVVDGTLDHPGDEDRGWSVEARIPWAAFANSGGEPKAGDVWKFALCRYDYGPEGTKPVLMSSAPLERPSFHRYEDYGRLHFEGPKPDR